VIVIKGPEKRSARRAPGELEADVLGVLWASDEPLSPSDVQERLAQPLAYTTVATILIRLSEKGMAERKRSGRAYLYSPTVQEADHLSEQMRRVLARSGDQQAALQGLVDSLSPEEEAVLLGLLTRGRQKAKGS
jgi:predicted transcriptional regulator